MAKRVRITNPETGAESECFDDDHSLAHYRARGWVVDGDDAETETSNDDEPPGSDQE